MESDVIALQDVFVARPPDEDAVGQAHIPAARGLLAPLACTGLKPHFLEKMAANGVTLPANFFEQETELYRPSFATATFAR
jgi:hypothetical protein